MNNAKTSIQMPYTITGRYAHRIVYFMQSIRSKVFIRHDGRNINAKSLLGLLSLQLKEKDICDIFCYGDNENEINADLQKIEGFILSLTNEENN